MKTVIGRGTRTMKWFIGVWCLIVLSLTLAALVLSGCGVTIPTGLSDALQDALTNRPPVSTTTTTTQPPAVPPEAPAPARTNLCGCDLSAPLADGPYDDAYMSSHAHAEECNVETETGLMARYCVWIFGRGAWWLQSSIASGHVRRDGDSLVAECHTTKGFRYHVRGFADYEPQTTEANPRLCATGNRCPYNGERRYIIVECRKLK